MANQEARPIYELQGICKSFGHVEALKDVGLEVHPGEIHTPDRGSILYKRRRVHIGNYRDSQAIGIATIYQDRALVDSVSIYRNIFMGNELLGPLGAMNKRKMREDTSRVLQESISIGLSDPDALVGDLSRAIYFKAQLLLLDEPTNALSVKESQQVMAFVEGLKEEGVSSIFVTHNLYHVYSIADRFVILNRGLKVGDYLKSEISVKRLEEIIVAGSTRAAAG
jgi:simple sugar transport system ATP-binding protein